MGLTKEDFSSSSAPLSKFVSIVIALLLVAGLCAGYLLVRRQHAQQRAAVDIEQQKQTQSPRSPILNVTENDAQLKNGQNILSGSAHNIGTKSLEGLVIEFELTKRQNAEKTSQAAVLEKDSLGPDEQVKYHLAIPANTYRAVRIARIYARSNPDEELIFSSVQGLQRPKQAPPGDFADNQAKKKRTLGNDEFLNSPDKPVSLP